jgi:hypothetical protein
VVLDDTEDTDNDTNDVHTKMTTKLRLVDAVKPPGRRQRADRPGDHPQIRRAARQVLRQCEQHFNRPFSHLTIGSLQVCELDIIFNFEKAYFMLDELLIGGEVQETSKKNVLKAIAAQDLLQEVIRHTHI